MGNLINKTLAIGNSKKYYQVENEFEAVGTLYVNHDMYYVAAHPKLGLWLCSRNIENVPIVIGFIKWEYISRIIVDEKNGLVFIVLNNYDEAIKDAGFEFRKIYKKSHTHIIESQDGSKETAIKLSRDMFSGNILPYLQQKYPVTNEEIKGAGGSIWWQVVIVVVIVILIILKFLF